MKPSIAISILAMLMGVSLSCVAAYFSVIGIATMFGGAFLSVAIMAGFLEASKLVGASWLYRNWAFAPRAMKVYMSTAIVILVLITSAGIFGFLSKAHIEQTMLSDDNSIQIEQIDTRIERQQRQIDDADRIIAQLDASVETLIEYDKISGETGAIAIREQQTDERNRLNAIIDQASDRIADLQDTRMELRQEKLGIEAEVGPIRYVAQLFKPDSDTQDFEAAIRWFSILLVFVFDPLAICLLLAGNTGLMYRDVAFKDGRKYVEVDEDSVMKMENEDDT